MNKDSRNEVHVRKIFDMVENKTVNRQLPAELKNKFREGNYQSFFEALNGVEEYTFERNSNIPATINIGRLQGQKL